MDKAIWLDALSDQPQTIPANTQEKDMSIRVDFETLKAQVNNAIGTRKIPTAGTYDVKLAGIEQTTSKNGRAMARITFEILSGEFAGCWTRKYVVIQDAAKDLEANSWKYSILIRLATNAYGIQEDRINDASVEDGYDLLSNCIRLLQKYVGQDPLVRISLVRKEAGKDADGNVTWKDEYEV